MLSVIRYVNDNNSTTYVVNGSAEARKSKVPYGTIKATDFTFTIGSDGTVTNISNQGYEFTPLEEDVSYSEDDFIKAIQQRTDNNPGAIAIISYDLDDLSLGGYSSIRVQYRSTYSSNSLWVYMYSGKVAKFYTSYSLNKTEPEISLMYCGSINLDATTMTAEINNLSLEIAKLILTNLPKANN